MDNIVMISYLKSGRCWWLIRVFDNDTFDLLLTSTQPSCDIEVKRQQYAFSELEKVVSVGELKDWIGGVIGINKTTISQ